MSAAPARSAKGLRQRPVFLLGCVAVGGFLFAGELGMLGVAILFTLVVWALDL